MMPDIAIIGNGRVEPLEFLDHLVAIHAGHEQIDDDQVEWALLKRDDRLATMIDRHHLVPRVDQQHLNASKNQCVVVYNQDPKHGSDSRKCGGSRIRMPYFDERPYKYNN